MIRVNSFDDSWTASFVGFKQHIGTYSGIAVRDIGHQASGQLRVAAFDGSGVMEYRQGPHEGWAIKIRGVNTGGPSNDGFDPIVPSGQIRAIPTLQNTYENSMNLQGTNAARIVIGTGGGALQFATDNRKFNLLPWANARAPISISGVSQYNTGPVSSYDPGDLTFITHGNVIPGLGATSEAVGIAQSLGVGSLALNTSSGVTNLMMGSGIGFYVQSNARNIGVVPENWTRFPFETVAIGDLNYSVDSSLSGIRVWVPGLYKVDYNVGFEKTVGTTARTMGARLVKFEASQITDAININGARVVNGSYSWAQITNITALTRDSARSSVLVNVLTAGALLGVEGTFVGQGAVGQNASSIPSGTSIVIQRIGPNRSGF